LPGEVVVRIHQNPFLAAVLVARRRLVRMQRRKKIGEVRPMRARHGNAAVAGRNSPNNTSKATVFAPSAANSRSSRRRHDAANTNHSCAPSRPLFSAAMLSSVMKRRRDCSPPAADSASPARALIVAHALQPLEELGMEEAHAATAPITLTAMNAGASLIGLNFTVAKPNKKPEQLKAALVWKVQLPGSAAVLDGWRHEIDRAINNVFGYVGVGGDQPNVCHFEHRLSIRRRDRRRAHPGP